MKSPFPGMHPYIEACGLWGDFHYSLVYKIYESLADAAPPRYLVRTGERSNAVLVEPDIREDHREAFVEIYQAGSDQRLVTSIEVLSPSNKLPNSPGWDLYLRKRQGLLRGGANLVEMDLLRVGRRMPMLDPWPDCPYTLLVARSDEYCQVWPTHFRQPLPTIPVPLAKHDPDIPLNLQPMIEEIYQRSRYARSIDYTRPLTPPLGLVDASWLEQRLRSRPGGR